jgi:putative SOS response-associated peptidase YedK
MCGRFALYYTEEDLRNTYNTANHLMIDPKPF